MQTKFKFKEFEIFPLSFFVIVKASFRQARINLVSTQADYLTRLRALNDGSCTDVVIKTVLSGRCPLNHAQLDTIKRRRPSKASQPG